MEYIKILLIFLQVYVSLCKVDEKCLNYANDINYHHPIENYETPNPLGKWVSSRCEIVPNKKYILRRFDILPSDWNGFIYHYSDSWCTKPTFIVKVIGTYEILAATATTNSKASVAAKFIFKTVHIRTKSAAILETILDHIEENCPSALPNFQSMQKDAKINLDNFINRDLQIDASGMKKRCRYFFGLHHYSYQKIRMVKDKTEKTIKFIGKTMSKYDTLYFADIPPFPVRVSRYGFNEFQFGLSRIDRPGCPVCYLATGDVNKHPILPVPKNRADFSGQWVSQVCEMSDATSFVTRFYEISPKVNGKDYGIIHMYANYYTDQDCEEKAIQLINGGIYRGNLKNEIKDVMNINIEYTSLAITAYSREFLTLLKGSTCGDSSKWNYNVMQNVTSSLCNVIGAPTLPNKVSALVRVIRGTKTSKLYIKEIDKRGPNDVGTYFTKNLVSCSSVSKDIIPIRTTTEAPIVTHRVIPVDPDVIKKLKNHGTTQKVESHASRLHIPYGFSIYILALLVVFL